MRIIAGTYKGRTLKTTTGPGLRPAMGKVREALFAMLDAQGIIWPKTRVLDLFAGSGSLGFEALSRGAAHVAFVEMAPYAAEVIRKNAALFQVEEQRWYVHQAQTRVVLAKRPLTPVDLVFIDPPYEMNALGLTLTSLLKNHWLAENALINAELEARRAFDPSNFHPALTLLADRAYGQTRVVLWNVNQH